LPERCAADLAEIEERFRDGRISPSCFSSRHLIGWWFLPKLQTILTRSMQAITSYEKGEEDILNPNR